MKHLKKYNETNEVENEYLFDKNREGSNELEISGEKYSYRLEEHKFDYTIIREFESGHEEEVIIVNKKTYLHGNAEQIANEIMNQLEENRL